MRENILYILCVSGMYYTVHNSDRKTYILETAPSAPPSWILPLFVFYIHILFLVEENVSMMGVEVLFSVIL